MEHTTAVMTVQNIQDRVYLIRGQQVMLDYDLAEVNLQNSKVSLCAPRIAVL